MTSPNGSPPADASCLRALQGLVAIIDRKAYSTPAEQQALRDADEVLARHGIAVTEVTTWRDR